MELDLTMLDLKKGDVMKWELTKEPMHSDPTRTCYRIRKDGITVNTIYDAVDDEAAKAIFNGFIEAVNRQSEPVVIAIIVTGEGTNP